MMNTKILNQNVTDENYTTNKNDEKEELAMNVNDLFSKPPIVFDNQLSLFND